MINRNLAFNVGADPELNLIAPNERMIHADDFTGNIFDVFGYNRQFGVDDAGDAMELRPRPSENLYTLINNIRQILTRGLQTFGIFDWITTSNPSSPVGGHIHLELKEQLYADSINKYQRSFFSFYLPIALADRTKHFLTRTSNGYGHIGQLRSKPHSKKYTMEIRSPSAEWLTTPETAAATLAYCAMIHNEILFHPEIIARSPILITDSSQYSIMENAIKEPNNHKQHLQELKQLTYDSIKKFELFKPFREEIEFLFNSEAMIAAKEKANYEIIHGWGLNKPPSHKNFITAPKLSDTQSHILNWLDNAGIRFVDRNHDNGVEPFAEALKDRIIAYNWKPQHHYVLFGIRQPINHLLVANKQLGLLHGQEALTNNTLKQQATATFTKLIKKFHTPPNTLFIGLPKTLRRKANFEPFLELIHYLEFNPAVTVQQQLPKIIPTINIPKGTT